LAGIEGFCEEEVEPADCWAWAAMNSLLMRLGATPVTTDAMADTADEVALGGPETGLDGEGGADCSAEAADDGEVGGLELSSTMDDTT